MDTKFQLAFSLLDADSDGFISFKELENINSALEFDFTQKELVEMVVAALEGCGRDVPQKEEGTTNTRGKKSFAERYGYEEEDLKMDWKVFFSLMNKGLSPNDMKTAWALLNPKRAKGKEFVGTADMCRVLEVLSGSSEKWSDETVAKMLSDAGVKEQVSSAVQYAHFKKMWEGSEERKGSPEPQ